MNGYNPINPYRSPCKPTSRTTRLLLNFKPLPNCILAGDFNAGNKLSGSTDSTGSGSTGSTGSGSTSSTGSGSTDSTGSGTTSSTGSTKAAQAAQVDKDVKNLEAEDGKEEQTRKDKEAEKTRIEEKRKEEKDLRLLQ